MKRLRCYANRMLALMLAGTLTAGGLSFSAFAAEASADTSEIAASEFAASKLAASELAASKLAASELVTLEPVTSELVTSELAAEVPLDADGVFLEEEGDEDATAEPASEELPDEAEDVSGEGGSGASLVNSQDPDAPTDENPEDSDTLTSENSQDLDAPAAENPQDPDAPAAENPQDPDDPAAENSQNPDDPTAENSQDPDALPDENPQEAEGQENADPQETEDVSSMEEGGTETTAPPAQEDGDRNQNHINTENAENSENVEAAPSEESVSSDPLTAANATAAVKYNLNNTGVFKGRTKKNVADRYSDALNAGTTYMPGDSSTWYAKKPSLQKPYAAGKLTRDTLLVMQEMTDFYRWLTGADPLKEACVHSEDLQAGALVRNFEFNHSISDSSKPSDMSSKLWRQGADVWHNILAWRYTPRDCITGWMNEGYSYGSWDTVGHRYALIGKSISGIQFGYAGLIGIGVDTAYENDTDGFAAFPAPGYMPSSTVLPSMCAWSLDLDTSIAAVEDAGKVTVTITNQRTKKSFTRKTSADTLQAYYDQLIFAQPDDADGGYYSDSYTVKVAGLKDVKTGKAAEIQYTVTFFDMPQASSVSIDPSEADLATTGTLQLKATVSPSTAEDKKITWTSSDPSVATVDRTGKVKAIKYGKVTITAATSNGKTAVCKIQTRFKDVTNTGKSYFKPVYWAVDQGITVCTVIFRPEDPVTRGEFVAFLWRLAGKPQSKAKVNFKDVNSNTKFYDAIRWAVGKKIIYGYTDGNFKPDNEVTRGETATMLWRYAGRPAAKSGISPFSDIPASSLDSFKAIMWGSENGIIYGSDGKFMKNDGCTRGQVVTFLYRYARKF